MSRRRLVAIISASVILGIAFVLAAIVVSVTQTGFGRERVRQYLTGQVAASMRGRGSMYIGRISGGFLTGVVVDSLAIRDEEDSLFLATGPVHVTYDPRDLIDRRLLISHLRVERPVVNLRRHADGVWNFKRIFPSGPAKPRRTERGFGDYIVIDSAEVVDAHVVLTQAWRPPDSLTGARRDSALRVALGRWRCPTEFWRDPDWLATPCGHEVRETREGLKRTYRWRIRQAILGYARIADPDTAGRLFAIHRLDVDEPDPPFAFRNVAGPVRWLGDTIRFDVRHWDLPGSAGTAAGSVSFGKGPMRYDIHVVGDSVSLADVNWVYPTLPKNGGGTMKLHIKNDRQNLQVLEYALTDMDVRAAGSHLVGDMTFGVGAPVLIVKDVAIRANPVDFRLVEQLSGEPLPVPWRGQIAGTVRARGGPLTRWLVDDAKFVFRDANVPGAVTRGSASGGLDILVPALTKFRGFDLELETLDLRTIRHLYPNFARLGGTVAGRATLDSSWLDVRFRDADLTHRDGPGVATRATGSGRITTGSTLVYDVDLQVSPISFTMLARSYPIIPFRGPYAGPVRVQGTMDSLLLITSLAGEGGTVAYSGYVDADSVGGYAAHGVTRTERADVRTLFGVAGAPATQITGRFATDLRFDSLANMVGTIGVELDRSRVDSVRVFPSEARLVFGGGRVRIDTLRLETSAALLTAAGAIGLEPAVTDTLRYTVLIDSLGGLRPYLRPPRRPPPLVAAAGDGRDRVDGRGPSAPPYADSARRVGTGDTLATSLADSLSGTVAIRGLLAGSLDTLGTLSAAGTVAGRELFVGGHRARTLRASYDLADLLRRVHGRAELALDTMAVSGVSLSGASAAVELTDPAHGRLSASVVSETGPRLSAALGFARAADTVHVALDSLDATLADRRWALAAPTRLHLDSTGIALDSLVLRDGTGGAIALAGELPASGPLAFSLTVDSLPLADLGELAQAQRDVGGYLTFEMRAAGTRAEPVMQLSARAASVRFGNLRVPRVDASARYGARRVDGQLLLLRAGAPVLSVTGTLPVDLALGPVPRRLLNDSLRARIFADSVDLALLEAMSPAYLSGVTGIMFTDIGIAGTWSRPTVSGRFEVARGEIGLPRLGIRLREVNADVALTRDAVTIRRVSVMSGERNGTALLTGSIGLPTESIGDAEQLRLDLAFEARNFQAVRQRRLADLEISSRLFLRGPFARAELTGNTTIERGSLYVQDAPQKQLVALDDPDFINVVDTTIVTNRRLLRLPGVVDTLLVRNLTVSNVGITIGDDVWLRSQAANVKLGGSVAVLKTGDRLALAGTLLANRGEYRLDLGLVQRRFDVTQGSISFFGEPGINPALDITAVHTVRQANREDVRIRASIGGTLLQPRLTLTSDERIPISTTEILSYLVFGAPSFAIGQSAENALRPVAAALLPTLGTVAEREITERFGFFDLVQIQAGTLRDGDGVSTLGGTAQGVLAGSRIGLGKQWGERTFITANAGLCQFARGGTSTTTFAQSLGFSVERRLGRTSSLEVSWEPAAEALVCNTTRSLEINTPRQLGFNLFREWSF